ncbi:MAG: serine hydrolase domain-containing protein [Microthrixaceae bacterium]
MTDHPFSRTTAAIADRLDETASWSSGSTAAAVFDRDGVVATHGIQGLSFALASITKLVTALTTLVAVEEGTVSLSEPLGPDGSTVRHVLAHAGGFSFDGPEIIAKPGTRRIYSNTGYEVLAEHLAKRAGIPFIEYMREAVLMPLGMKSTTMTGTPAAGLDSTILDVCRLGGELMHPTLIDVSTWQDAISVQFPELSGILPGWGLQEPCAWGLGPELKGNKDPHWMGSDAPPWTLGHFGGSGTFLWVDPVAGIGCAVLTEHAFDEWAVRVWPDFSDKIRALMVAGS